MDYYIIVIYFGIFCVEKLELLTSRIILLVGHVLEIWSPEFSRAS
jgi:hypothetical protein